MEKSFQDVVRSRLRYPGGLHEWLPVERADLAHRWGVPFEELSAWRTPVDDVAFIAPDGRHGGPGSARAHLELVGLMGSSRKLPVYAEKLARWADHRLAGGRETLPAALRAPSSRPVSRDRAVPRLAGKGVVIVWLATAADAGALGAYLAEHFHEEDDEQPISHLAADFDLPWIDHDFLELQAVADLEPIAALLARFSFGSSFSPAAAAEAARLGLQGARGAVVLYDSPYPPLESGPATAPLRLLGAFEYDRRRD